MKGLLAAESFIYWPAVYNSMPRFGLARAGEHVAATGRRETARRRLGQDGEASVPTPAPPGS
jgi:hypothetical protein